MSAFINISGQKFGRLTAIKVVERQRRGSTVELIWLCRCDCGNMKRVKRGLLGKSVNSCGCLRKEVTRERGKKNKGNGHPFGIAARNKLYDHYKRGAESRGLEFRITLEQFINITQQDCFYCGIEPKQVARNKGNNGYYVYNGVDRVDNNEGYIIDNCVPCCGTCNKAKLSMTQDEFYAWIERVYHRRHPNTISAEINWGDETAKWYKDTFADKENAYHELDELGISK